MMDVVMLRHELVQRAGEECGSALMDCDRWPVVQYNAHPYENKKGSLMYIYIHVYDDKVFLGFLNQQTSSNITF